MAGYFTGMRVVLMAAEEEVELNKIVGDFCLWQEKISIVLGDNEALRKELRTASKKIILLEEAAGATQAEITQLRTTVDKLHHIIARKCDFEDESSRLKEELNVMKRTSSEIEASHQSHEAELVREIQDMTTRHQQEMEGVRQQAKSTVDKAHQDKQQELQEKMKEVNQLQRDKTELERAKHTEIVKLRLEYDSKMLKMQKQHQQLRTQTNHTSSANSDIFRKKLQHLKAESEREITFLRKRVQDLEKQHQGTGNHATKKMRLH